MIFYGAPVREKIKLEIKKRVKKLEFRPCLAIVQVGDREDSNIYIRNKVKFGEEVGILVNHFKFPKDVNQEEVLNKIKELNKDKNISGIIVQLPLPEGFDSNLIISTIEKKKDADGLRETGENSESFVTPATARAVVSMLRFYKINVKNKKITVLGRSKLAGGPIAKVLTDFGAKVSSCGKDTLNIEEISKSADILISATGQPNLVNSRFVNKNQIVIDVGINRVDSGDLNKTKIVGDVAFEEVLPNVAAISPVPGGVGLVTVACLFENLLDLCYDASDY